MTLRVYLIGSSHETTRVAGVARALTRYVGVEITEPWWEQIDALRAEGRTDADLTEDERREAATADLTAMSRAHLAWLLVSKQPSFGAGYEVGRAVSLGTPVVASGPGAGEHVFHSLMGACFSTDAQALDWVYERMIAPLGRRAG